MFKNRCRLWDYVNEKLTDDEYAARLKPGMVFHPKDARIIVDLLIKKIKNEKLPRNLIKMGNIYEIDPEKLAGEILLCLLFLR